MDVIVGVLALLISAVLGWLVVEGVLAIARVVPDDREGKIILEPEPPERRVLRGGTVIGILERLSVTGLIIVGQPGLIAAVVAIKSLGRWSELKEDPAVSERFIIGSLASCMWAGACGFIALQLMIA